MKHRSWLVSTVVVLVLAAAVPSPVLALDESDRLFLVGERGVADGLHALAVRALERFVADYPNDGRIALATLLLGRARLAVGLHERALETFRKAQTLAPPPGPPSEARLWEGEALFYVLSGRGETEFRSPGGLPTNKYTWKKNSLFAIPVDQAKRIGIAWSGQTARLAPADKVLYALRDAIGAVDSVPLIASSILCKKLASGAEIVVLDVKCGRGAFMKSLDAAKELAHWLEEVGTLAGLSTRAVITDMDQPLGRTAGNAIEVREAVDVLSGEPGPVRDLCVFLAEHTLRTAGLDPALVQKALDSGRALAKFHEWLLAQGAAPDALERLPQAALRVEVVSARAGWVSSVDAGAVGSAVIALGGGRSQPGGPIDPAVGIETWRRVGDPVSVGEKVFTVHASKQPDQWLLASLENAVTVSPTIVSARPLVLVNR